MNDAITDIPSHEHNEASADAAAGAPGAQAGRGGAPLLLRAAAALPRLRHAAARPGRDRQAVRRRLRAQGLRSRLTGRQAAQEVGANASKDSVEAISDV